MLTLDIENLLKKEKTKEAIIRMAEEVESLQEQIKKLDKQEIKTKEEY
jgi:signal recognition particle receptor subunit beta